ncbi:MAG: hypothetical protein U0V56_13615 [Actinomycetota bacterium]
MWPLANMGIIEREGFVQNSATEAPRAHPIVGDVRGVGLFMAVELHDPVGNEDFPPGLKIADQVTASTMRMGVFGPRPLGGSTLAFAPPLVFTRAQAERTVEVLDAALSETEAGALPTAVPR